jgi:hypothetical protein
VLVTGGAFISETTDVVEALADAEIYDPGANAWALAGPMTSPRVDHRATLLTDGRVLITGGLDANSHSLSTAEVFDPAVGAFTPVEDAMQSSRRGHTATLLKDGRVLVAGGESGLMNETTTIASAEIYNPAVGRFTSTDAMRSARSGHAEVRLGNGAVLVAGGFETRKPLGEFSLNTAELFDPVLEQWTPGIKMSSLRESHTTTLLASGEVLAAGGLRYIPLVSGLLSASLKSAEVLRLKPIGAPFEAASECELGFCADGVCCDAACDAGLCDACSAFEGASVDGACTALAMCSPFQCEAMTGKCPTSCESIDQCAPGFACDLSGACLPPPPVASTEDTSGCAAGDPRSGEPRWPAGLAALSMASLAARRRTRAAGPRAT